MAVLAPQQEQNGQRKPITWASVVPADAMRGAFAILDAWKLSARDGRILLGLPPERTYYAWQAGNVGRVPHDTLRRIGYIAGIYKALGIIYSDPRLADDWIRRPNAFFVSAKRR